MNAVSLRTFEKYDLAHYEFPSSSVVVSILERTQMVAILKVGENEKRIALLLFRTVYVFLGRGGGI